MATETTLPPPTPDQAYMRVSALEAGIIYIPIEMIIADAEPKMMSYPSLAFLLRHSKTKFRIVFDLGARRDFEAHPPAMKKIICNKASPSTVPQTVTESLEKGGVAPDTVDTVILSHLHWDQYVPCPDRIPALTHAASATTRATFIVGEGSRELLRTGYPANPDGHFSSTAVPAERTRFVSTAEMSPLGPYPHALDLLGDGSVYIVDAPGHVAGHINVLARTSAHTWVLLAGDSAHDPRIVAGETAYACAVDAAGVKRCIMHVDMDAAEANLERVKTLRRAGVQVVIAHDAPWRAANRDAFLPGSLASI